MASYPTAIKNFTPVQDRIDVVEAGDIDELQEEIRAIQVALGIQPYQSGLFPTVESVSERLDAMDTAISTLQSYFQPGGKIPQSSVTGLTTALSTEQSARIAGDAGLQTAINTVSTSLDNYKKTRLRAYALCQRNSPQTIPNAAWTDLTGSAMARLYGSNGYTPYMAPGDPDFEEDGTFHTATTITGTYYLTCRAAFSGSSSAGKRGLRCIASSGLVIGQIVIDAAVAGTDYMLLTVFITRAPDPDYYFKFQAYQNSGVSGGLSILAATNANPFQVEATFVPL